MTASVLGRDPGSFPRGLPFAELGAPHEETVRLACLWCGGSFQMHRGGSPQRFCRAAHRMAFWSALRRWGERAVTTGTLPVGHIKSGDSAACTLLQDGWSPLPTPIPVRSGNPENADLRSLLEIPASAASQRAAEAEALLTAIVVALGDLEGDDFATAVRLFPPALVLRLFAWLDASG